MLRDDLSSKLIHLTRGETNAEAANAFLSIIGERRLLGSTRDIRGGYRCLCFTEAPVGKLAHVLAAAEQMRYKSFGIMVDKKWLFDRGGRPVIYQPESEYDLLHESQRFRHVRYEPGSVDFSWEREWRIKTELLEIEPASATLIVPTRTWEKWFQDKHVSMLARRAVSGTIGPKSVTEFPWHFIVLEDLGVPIPAVSPPEIS